jgi:hypothetical protein
LIISESLSGIENKIVTVSQEVSGDQLVMEAQNHLQVMGFPLGNYGTQSNGIDGIFGEATKACLQTF